MNMIWKNTNGQKHKVHILISVWYKSIIDNYLDDTELDTVISSFTDKTSQYGPVIEASCNRPDWVGTLHLYAWGRKQIHFPKRYFHMMGKTQKYTNT